MNRPVNDPYFNPKRTRDILFGVLLVHIGIIAVPLIYSSSRTISNRRSS